MVEIYETLILHLGMDKTIISSFAIFFGERAVSNSTYTIVVQCLIQGENKDNSYTIVM